MIRLRAATAVAALCLLVACPRSTGQEGTTPATSPNERPVTDTPDVGGPAADADVAHNVVFADRTSQGYLLLVDDAHAEKPSREALKKLVRAKLAGAEDDPEVNLLLGLIDTEPMVFDPNLQGRPNDGQPRPTLDLLGLHIDMLPLRSSDGELISVEQLTDPILTRGLTDAHRASLAARRKVLLLRVDYRNRFAVRGLRLLQTLVRIVAAERRALIHDPDTGETMNLATFSERRLLSSLGNVSDQLAVVPFPDPLHRGSVRLATRGMRRFGSVDFELDGLPRDPAVLQAATHLMYGLAYRMVRLGEFDATGYAVELPQVVTVERDDVVQAYGRREDAVPDCADCPGAVALHLVERPAQPHDPPEHVVARVVAPREVSDEAGYDQAAWARGAVRDLFGQ